MPGKKNEVQLLEEIARVGQAMTQQMNLDDLLWMITGRITKLLDAERTSLFIYDEEKHELWSKIAEGEENEIRIPANVGVAGYIASMKKIWKTENAYLEEVFNPNIDRLTGFRTRNILGTPMLNTRGKLIGIIEVINKKKHRRFSKTDEYILTNLSTYAAIAIENSQLVKEKIREERLSTVGKMASGIVHDLKNPLHCIQGFVSLIAGKVTEKNLIRYTNIISEEIDRLAYMANEILDYTRGTIKYQTSVCSIKPFLKNVFEKYISQQVTPDFKFQMKIPYTCHVFIDEVKMTRVIENLFINAREALPQRGGKITIQTKKAGKGVYIDFTDNGKGIPVQKQHKIFEPFQTFGKKMGVGLGLAISKKNIEDMGGNINVSSRPGKGTVFRIFLPRVIEKSNIIKYEPVITGRHFDNHKHTILLVDDEKWARESIKELLERYEYTVRVAENADRAKRELKGFAGIDLVLTDINMPDSTGKISRTAGFKLIEWIKKYYPRIPVAMFTSNSVEDYVDIAIKKDVGNILTKPIRETELLHSIKMWLSGDKMFGLMNYLPPGCKTIKKKLFSSQETPALGRVLEKYITGLGFPEEQILKFRLLLDEMLINAIFHSHGFTKIKESGKHVRLPKKKGVEVSFGGNKDVFGISVTDFRGTLTRKKVLQTLKNAIQNKMNPFMGMLTPHGRGLYLMMVMCESYYINIKKNVKTEVIMINHRARKRPENEQLTLQINEIP